jgi:hypothetical protein
MGQRLIVEALIDNGNAKPLDECLACARAGLTQ